MFKMNSENVCLLFQFSSLKARFLIHLVIWKKNEPASKLDGIQELTERPIFIKTWQNQLHNDKGTKGAFLHYSPSIIGEQS